MNEDCPIFDTGEGQSNLFPSLDVSNYEYEVKTLDIGDFVLSERCCGEIKRVSYTGNDLKSSLFDGRLYEQSEQRRDNYEINIMIIEITSKKKLFDEHFTKQHLQSLEFSLIIDFNTHVYYTESTKDTIELIYKIWERLKKGKRYVTPINKRKIPFTLKQKQIRFISGLLGIGKIKATELIQDWGTPMNVFDWIVNDDKSKYKVEGFDKEFFYRNQELLLIPKK